MGLIIVAVIIYLALCVVAGNISKEKSGSFASGFWLSIILSPLLGILFAYLNDDKLQTSEITIKKETIEKPTNNVVATIECSNCLELISSDSIVCRYCNHTI